MFKVFISTGEVSGDHYGALISKSLLEIDPNITISGIGGKEMQNAGVKLISNIRDIEAMGAVEVISKIPRILGVLKKTVAYIKENRIDVFLPIDNPGFNFRVIKKISSSNTRVFYFIPPQVWAWRTKRVYFLKEHVDKLAVIFPFEKEFYSKFNIQTIYTGHPLAEAYNNKGPRLSSILDRYKMINDLDTPLNLALLPGSRESEIRALLPVMLQTHIALKKKYRAVISHIAVSPNSDPDYIERFIPCDLREEIKLYGNIDDVFHISDFAIIASGTATLQASLYPVPYVLLYKMHPFSFFLAKYFVKIKYIGIANIILDRLVAPEFIQGHAKSNLISSKICELIADTSQITAIIKSFHKIKKMLYNKNAMKKIAHDIQKFYLDGLDMEDSDIV